MEAADTETQRTIPTFQRKPEQTHQTSEMGSVGVHKSFHVIRKRGREIRRSKELKMKKSKDEVTVKDEIKEEDDDDEDGEEREEEIERKVHALQRIVPGGVSFGVDKLFDETAGYILALQYQIKTLRALTTFFERLEKEKSKFGG